MALVSAAALAARKPVSVGLYTDCGSRGGANCDWAELLGASPDVKLKFLSGQNLRDGALKDIDLLVMPGGTGYGQYESMQEQGAQAIRDFVRGGGRYFGTCAGIALLLNEEKRVALLPFKRINGHYMRGGGDLEVEFTDEAVKKFDFKKKDWTLKFHHGPILVPGNPVEGTTATVLAFCRNAIDEKNSFPKKKDDMIGTAAFVYADCGKGRIFACNCHPECTEDTREIIRRGFAVLMDREMKIPELKPPHVIPVQGVKNVRDLGGWKGLGGKTVRRKQIFRTGALNGISGKRAEVDANGRTNFVPVVGRSYIDDANRNFFLKGMRIKTDIDLRNDPECREMTGSPLGETVNWAHLHVKSYTFQSGTNCHHRKIFDLLTDEKNLPADIHCALGQDRTGTIAMLVLAVLGVSEEDIMTDYLATRKGLKPVKLEKALGQLKADYAAPTLAESAEKYLLSIGVTAERIAAFRDFMLVDVK